MSIETERGKINFKIINDNRYKNNKVTFLRRRMSPQIISASARDALSCRRKEKNEDITFVFIYRRTIDKGLWKMDVKGRVALDASEFIREQSHFMAI